MSESNEIMESSTPCNPLLLEDVLEIVIDLALLGIQAKQGMTKDVQGMRLVCKLWNDVVGKWYVKQRGMINMGLYDITRAIQKKDKRAQEFVMIFGGSSFAPKFNKIRLGPNVMYKLLLSSLLRIHMDSLVNIQLHFDNNLQIKFTEKSLTDPLTFPNLKKMGINLEKFSPYHDVSEKYESFHFFVRTMLSACMMLDEFAIRTTKTEGNLYSDVSTAIMKEVAMNLPTTVKKLCLRIALVDDMNYVPLLQKKNLKLRELELTLDFVKPVKVLKYFIRRHAEYLRTLCIRRDHSNQNVTWDLPLLPKLKLLQLKGKLNVRFEISKETPSLNRLDLSRWMEEDLCYNVMIDPNVKCLKIKEVDLSSHFNCSRMIEKLEHFSNLAVLNIGASANVVDTILQVFRFLPHLDELKWTFPDMLKDKISGDSILSGVNKILCEQLVIGKDFSRFTLRAIQTINTPSLLNLKRLKKLTIEDPSLYFVMTNFSAHFVFSKMPMLCDLNISKSHITTFHIDKLRALMNVRLARDGFEDLIMDPNDEWAIVNFTGAGVLDMIEAPGLGPDRYIVYKRCV